MSWDRTQRIELELLQAQATNRGLREQVGDLLIRLARVTIERDNARAVAVRLEQELAHHE